MAQPIQNQIGRSVRPTILDCLVVFLLTLTIIHSTNALGHDHEQGHNLEKPSFKYRREENVQAQKVDIENENILERSQAYHSDGAQESHSHGQRSNTQTYDHLKDRQLNDTNDNNNPNVDSETVYLATDNKRSLKLREAPSGLSFKAFGSTALISISPVFILLLIPLENAGEHKKLHRILLSFASGGLIGDAFLHLIPHAVSPRSHGDEILAHKHNHTHLHDHGDSQGSRKHYMGVGFWILSGIIVFLMVDKYMRYVKDEHSHDLDHLCATPKINTGSLAKSSPKKKKGKRKHKYNKGQGKTDEILTDGARVVDKNDNNKFVDKVEVFDKRTYNSGDKVASSSKTGEEPTVNPAHGSNIKVTGYLNLAADFAHNFTDGLAIGASFLAGEKIGVLATITIFLHEVPRDIGDFAILIQSGYSKQKAVLLQLVTSVGAVLGTLCSLYVEGADGVTTSWIQPFTAGGIVYIALVSVIPELLEDSKIWQSIREILAMLTGVCVMVLIAL